MTPAKLYPRTALALLTALNLLNYIDRSVLFAVQDLVKAEFHRSDAAFGLLTSVFFIFYMCAAPFMGPLSLRFSRKRVIVAGALVWSGATLLTAVTTNFNQLLIRHTLVGIGEASFVILSPTFVADMFPVEKRGRVMGVFYLALPVGTALGYLLGGVMGPKYGWRAPFYAGAAPGVLLALLLLLLPEPALGQFDPPESKAPERDTLKSLLHNPAFLTATLGMAMMMFALGGLQVWMPTFLHRAHGYSLLDASIIFGLSTIANGLVASLAGGWISDRLAASNEICPLPRVRSQPGVGHSRHVRRLVCERQDHGRGHFCRRVFAAVEHRPAERRHYRFGRTPRACRRLGSKHFCLPPTRRCAISRSNRLSLGQVFAATCLCGTGHRDRAVFCHTVLRHALCPAITLAG